MLPSVITILSKLEKLMQLVFHPGIMQNHYLWCQKHFTIVNKISLDLWPQARSGLFAKMLTLILSLLLMLTSDDTTVLPSAKAKLFTQTFASNSTLDDSVAIPPIHSHFNSFIYNVISSKDFISAHSTLRGHIVLMVSLLTFLRLIPSLVNYFIFVYSLRLLLCWKCLLLACAKKGSSYRFNLFSLWSFSVYS